MISIYLDICYSYGKPWREPAGQPYLFGGKERRRFASLGDSDFHAGNRPR